jgi:hypothetical protein
MRRPCKKRLAVHRARRHTEISMKKTVITVHVDPAGDGGYVQLSNPRPRYPVSVDFDRRFTNPKDFRVPRRYRGKTIYIKASATLTMWRNPRGSRAVVRGNCGGAGVP